MPAINSASAFPTSYSSATSGHITSNLARELIAFLRQAAQRDAGLCECAFFCADWLLQLTGRDPLAAWRGFDGPPPQAWPLTFEQLLRDAGLVRVAAPSAGDIALILAHDGVPRAAVCTRDDGAAFVTAAAPHGLFGIRDARVMRAWTLP